MRHWPLFALKVTTPRLELRLPTLNDLDALADRAAEGVHDPAGMPFGVPWTDAPPDERARSTVQVHWFVRRYGISPGDYRAPGPVRPGAAGTRRWPPGPRRSG
ncbi:hypothetical protein [Microbispora sp. NBC_01389]|uniref:hypothetical protein n=1 Tax=Microbispora sp. NBC_01389 TaxID=2903584 RepID=UPI003244D0EB